MRGLRLIAAARSARCGAGGRGAAAGAGGALGGVGDVWKRSSQVGRVTAGVIEIAEGSKDLAKIATRVQGESLSLIDDVAATARAAGKNKWGQFSDVARFQFAEMTGRAFTQTVVKGSDRYLTNLDEGKKIVRTFTKITDNASAVAEFKEVDRVGSLGKRITDGFDEFSDWARTSKTTVEGTKTNTRQVRVVVDEAANDAWRGRGFDKYADLSKEERQALFTVKGDFAWSRPRQIDNRASRAVEYLSALTIDERKALRSGPELGVEMRTVKGTKRVRTTVRGVSSYKDVVRESVARTGKWERFRDPIVAGLKNAVQSASSWLSTDMGKVKVAYALQDFVVLPLEAYERNRAENESPDTTVRSAGFSWGGALRKGGKNLTALNKLGVFMPAAAPLAQMFANGMDRRGWDPSNAELSKSAWIRKQKPPVPASRTPTAMRFAPTRIFTSASTTTSRSSGARWLQTPAPAC